MARPAVHGCAEAAAFAEEHGWLYFETSAKSGYHVRDAFYLLACTVMNRLLESDPKNLINSAPGKDDGVRLALRAQAGLEWRSWAER